jgi:dynein heavy chain
MSLHEVIAPHREKLGTLLHALLADAVRFTRKQTKEYCATVDNNLVTSTLNILHTFWTPFIPIDGAYEVADELAAQLPLVLEKVVVFAVVWGAGGSSDTASRNKFDKFVREKLAEANLAEAVGLPDGLVYDYSCDASTNSWVPWMETLPPFELSPKVEFLDIIVPTLDSVRYMWVLERLVTHNCHVLCVGPTGTGKTLQVANKLMNGMPEQPST